MEKRQLLQELSTAICTAIVCSIFVTVFNVALRYNVTCPMANDDKGGASRINHICQGTGCENDETEYDRVTEIYLEATTGQDEITTEARNNVTGDDVTQNNNQDQTDDVTIDDVMTEAVTEDRYIHPYGFGVDCRTSTPPTTEYRRLSSEPLRTSGDIDEPISVCETALYAHNKIRALHTDTSPLSYDDELATRAEDQAIDVAHRLNFNEYAESVLYDENEEGSTYISAYYRYVNEDYVARETMADAVYSWYKWEECGFDTLNGEYTGCSDLERNNLERVLWRTSKKVGCGMATRVKHRNSGDVDFVTVVACEYYPPRTGRVISNMAPKTSDDYPVAANADLEPQGSCIDKMAYDCASHAMCRDDQADPSHIERIILLTYCTKTCVC